MVEQVQREKVNQLVDKVAAGLKELAQALFDHHHLTGSAVNHQKQKKIKAEKDPNAPKRNLSSYMLYSKHVRPDVVKKHPTLKAVDIAKIIGEKWNALSEKQKQPYVKGAEKEKARFDKETEVYNTSRGEPTKRKAEAEIKKDGSAAKKSKKSQVKKETTAAATESSEDSSAEESEDSPESDQDENDVHKTKKTKK